MCICLILLLLLLLRIVIYRPRDGRHAGDALHEALDRVARSLVQPVLPEVELLEVRAELDELLKQ